MTVEQAIEIVAAEEWSGDLRIVEVQLLLGGAGARLESVGRRGAVVLGALADGHDAGHDHVENAPLASAHSYGILGR
jgi:hypothetical protein